MQKQGEGEFHLHTEELKLYHSQFCMYLRMLVGKFEVLLQMQMPHTRRQSSNYQEAIDPEPCFAVCGRHVVVVGSILHNHCDCLMCLFFSWKVWKNQPQYKKYRTHSACEGLLMWRLPLLQLHCSVDYDKLKFSKSLIS